MRSDVSSFLRVPIKLVREKVILVGGEVVADVEAINEGLIESEKISESRGFHCYESAYKDIDFTLCITSIGGPCTDIAVQELASAGARIFIRAGTCGAISDKINSGDLVITQGAVRRDGTSKEYVFPEYPATAHYEVVSALVKAAELKRMPYTVGITLSDASLYAVNRRIVSGSLKSVSFGGYDQSWMNEFLSDMKKANVLNIEMEAATLLTLGNILGLKTGAVCGVGDIVPWEKPPEKAMFERALRNCLPVAYESLHYLQ